MSWKTTLLGSITPIEKLKGESLEHQCYRILKENNKINEKFSEIYDSYEEGFYDIMAEYVIVNNEIYKIEKLKDYEDENIFEIRKRNGLFEKGFDFVLSFYNGQFTLEEAIEKGLERIDKNE